MKYIIAGNYMEFTDWLKETGTRREDATYLTTYGDWDKKYAINPADVVKIGTYRDNLDWPKFDKLVFTPMLNRWAKNGHKDTLAARSEGGGTVV